MTSHRAIPQLANDVRQSAGTPSGPTSWLGRVMSSPGEGRGPADAPDSDRAPDDQLSPAQGQRKLRVVVVEDEAIIALDIEGQLTDIGVEVVGTAHDAAQAIRLAECTRPDFLTMDIHLQGERDGVSAAVEIFERLGIRSIFISAFNDPETLARGERAKPLGWITKPVRADRLRAKLRLLTDKPPAA